MGSPDNSNHRLLRIHCFKWESKQNTKSLLLFAGISSRFLICQSDESCKCNSGSFPKSEFLSPGLGHHTCTHSEEPSLPYQTLALQAFITAHSTQRTRYIIFAILTQWGCLWLKYYTCCTPQSLSNSVKKATNFPALWSHMQNPNGWLDLRISHWLHLCM